METTKLTKAELTKELSDKILFFQFAETGAMGRNGTVEFITAPATLIATILKFLTVKSNKSSIVKERIPAGREYIIDEIFPENKLPKVILTIREIYP